MLGERAIVITQTYSPKRAKPRTITVDGIPAIEMTVDGASEIGIEFGVSERIQMLVEHALRTTDAVDQRIAYSAADPGVPGRRNTSSSRSERRRAQT
jgi:hypothetical protein